ncbi:MAG: NADH-quinone oxidoreductase subunit C [Patescibacteria group bacterium]
MTLSLLREQIGVAQGSNDLVSIARAEFRTMAVRCVQAGAPLVFMYALDERSTRRVFVVRAVFSVPGSGFLTLTVDVPEQELSYPSLTTEIMAAHWFERLIFDQYGLVAEEHPDWRRLMHHENIPAHVYPLRKDFAWNTKLPYASEPYPMHAVQGDGIYEIPVGPIHAGIIEPGHFRFNVRGERIVTLEGKLFFKHKGVEKLVEGKTPAEALPFIERVSGDMVVAHTLAFAEAVEHASGMSISARADSLRMLWLEMERLTAHIFDIGNMGGMGTGFTFMAAQCFRVVEELRRMHYAIVGHRYLRGAITLGGAHDISQKNREDLDALLTKVETELETLCGIAYANDGLMERFETTGVLSRAAAIAYGARGVPARASGVTSDMRRDHPSGAYTRIPVTVATKTSGDVRARFSVRVLECAESLRLARLCLTQLPQGPAYTKFSVHAGSSLGWAESFRGAVIDWVRIDTSGKLDRVAISDPSFCNWSLFGEIGPGNIVPDFPLCNKSLNLSYSGTDL